MKRCVIITLWVARLRLGFGTHFLKVGQTVQPKSYFQELVEAFISEFSRKDLCTTIANLALCSGIYNLWHAINEIIFNEGHFNKLQLLKAIEFEVQLNLNGHEIKDKDNAANRHIASLWDVQFLSS